MFDQSGPGVKPFLSDQNVQPTCVNYFTKMSGTLWVADVAILKLLHLMFALSQLVGELIKNGSL